MGNKDEERRIVAELTPPSITGEPPRPALTVVRGTVTGENFQRKQKPVSVLKIEGQDKSLAQTET